MAGPNYVYFDLETQKSAAEVGGWHNKRAMNAWSTPVCLWFAIRLPTKGFANIPGLAGSHEDLYLVKRATAARYYRRRFYRAARSGE